MKSFLFPQVNSRNINKFIPKPTIRCRQTYSLNPNNHYYPGILNIAFDSVPFNSFSPKITVFR